MKRSSPTSRERERALLFCSGYMANLAVMSAFAARGQRVLLDRLSHASLIDGARLSGARLQRYAHADAAACGSLASQEGAPAALIATDGVFSMDGDLAPVQQLARIAATHEAWLAVDDAHGLGVVGEGGRGTLALAGLNAADVPLLIGTLGKAFGSCGAFVAGDADVIEFLMQKARTYIYTTALPQPVAAASRAALQLVRTQGWRRERLAAHVERFRRLAGAAGLTLLPSATPIQPLLLGSAAAALKAQAALARAGYRVVAIRPPTVPARRRAPAHRARRDAYGRRDRRPRQGAHRGVRREPLRWARCTTRSTAAGATSCCCTAGA